MEEEKVIFLMRNKEVKSAPPIVYLHGAMCDSSIWLTLSRRLAQALPGRAGYLVDLPNHGKSSKSGDISIDFFSQSIVDFMGNQKITKAVFVGHSMGGAIAQTIVKRFPQKVDRLVLLSTAAKFEKVHKIESIFKDDFEKGLKSYQAGDFSQAKEYFKAVLEIDSQDKAANLYLQRSNQWLGKEPPSDWDGVEVMKDK